MSVMHVMLQSQRISMCMYIELHLECLYKPCDLCITHNEEACIHSPCTPVQSGKSYLSVAGIKYDYGQVTVEELDLDDELADIDLEDDDDSPDQERSAGKPPMAKPDIYQAPWCRSGQAPRQGKDAAKAVCRNFASGECKFGDKCHFKHVATSSADKRPPAQYYSSPSSSRASTPSVSRPGSASSSWRQGSGAAGKGSRDPSPAPSQSRPGSARQQSRPRLPVVQQKMVTTFTVPDNKV